MSRDSREERMFGRGYFDRDRDDFEKRDDRLEDRRYRRGDYFEQSTGGWDSSRARDDRGRGGYERQGAWGSQAGWGGSSEGWSGQGGYGGYRGQNWGGPISYGGHYRGWAGEGEQDKGWGGGTGRYAGRGPKNWKRSDARIRDEVSERLSDHPDVDASDIEVEVRDGDVTLKGSVDHRQVKRLAEDIALSCSGVRDVHNHLRLQQHQTSPQSGRR